MKIPTFRRNNPAEALQATQTALAEADSKIRGLGEQRAARLLESDGVDEVIALDRQIEEQQKAAGILRDRIAALGGEIRRQGQLAAEREIAARVAETEKALAKRDATAAQLQNAIREFGKHYFDLIDQNREIAKLWRMSVNAHRVGMLGDRIIGREVSHALFAAGRPHNGICRLPAPGNAGLGITGDTSGGTLAQRIADASAALLEMIRALPTRQPEDEAA
jgi:hypothetical protein